MIYVDKLSLEVVNGGPYHGAVGFFLALGEKNQKTFSSRDILTEIVNNTNSFALKSPGVIIQDSIPDHDTEVTELASVLRDRGYGVIGYTWGKRKPMWLAYCQWNRVTLSEGAKWLGYTVNEIAMYFDKGEADIEIPKNNAAAHRMLLVEKKTKPQTLFQFLMNQPIAWNIVYPPSRTLSVDLL